MFLTNLVQPDTETFYAIVVQLRFVVKQTFASVVEELIEARTHFNLKVSSTHPVEVNSSNTRVCLTASQTSFLVFGGFSQQKKPTAK
ncbi:hypothetical protein Hanom_Chr12g01164081 [Helianthus anomalus]